MVAVRREVHGQDALHMPLQCHDAATCSCIPHTPCTMHVITSHNVYTYNVSTQQPLQEVAVHVLQKDLMRQPVESLCRAKAACYVCMIHSTVGAMCPYAGCSDKAATGIISACCCTLYSCSCCNDKTHKSYAQGAQSSGSATGMNYVVLRSASSSSRDTRSKSHQRSSRAAD